GRRLSHHPKARHSLRPLELQLLLDFFIDFADDDAEFFAQPRRLFNGHRLLAIRFGSGGRKAAPQHQKQPDAHKKSPPTAKGLLSSIPQTDVSSTPGTSHQKRYSFATGSIIR